MKSYTTYHTWKKYPNYLRKYFWKEHKLYKKLADKLNERQDDLKTFDTVQET